MTRRKYTAGLLRKQNPPLVSFTSRGPWRLPHAATAPLTKMDGSGPHGAVETRPEHFRRSGEMECQALCSPERGRLAGLRADIIAEVFPAAVPRGLRSHFRDFIPHLFIGSAQQSGNFWQFPREFWP